MSGNTLLVSTILSDNPKNCVLKWKFLKKYLSKVYFNVNFATEIISKWELK